MCGIVGLIQYDNKEYMLKKKVFNQLLFLDTVRGEDGTGIFYSKEFDVPSDSYKRALAAPDFMQLKPYRDVVTDIERYRFIIGHNRAATTGGVSTETSHPFHEDHIVLIHNGTLRDRVGLPSRTVDSNAIAASLSEKKDPIATLENLNGAYALIWHDLNSKCLYITKNSERPLHYVETNIGKLIGSEKGMLEWVIERNDELKQEEEIKEFEDYRLYKFWKTKKGKYFHNSTKYDCKVLYEKKSRYNHNTTGKDYYQETTVKVLEKIGLKEGEYIKLRGVKFDKYPSGGVTMLYGKLICRPVEDTNNNISAEYAIHSVSEKSAEKYMTKEFYAKVSSAHQDYYNSSKYKVNLNFLSELDEAKMKKESKKKGLVLPHHTKNKGILTLLPDGKWAGKKDFLEFVKCGCTICEGDIVWEDRTKIEWMESLDGGSIQPVCPECVEKLELDNYPGACTGIH